jgi:DNA-binding Lrp family transcriptional regulator
MQKSLRLEPDDLDLRLIKELEIDARQSNPDLAKKLDTSPTTIRRRLKKLLDAGVISIVMIPDANALGFKTRAMIGVNVRPGKYDNVASGLLSDEITRVVIATTGRYDIVLVMVCHSQQELLNFVYGELGKNPDVLGAEIMSLLGVKKYSWKYLRGDTGVTEEAQPRELDESELRLIGALELDPRASITSLSKKLGMSRISVRRKMQSLIADNIIRVVSIADPSALGFGAQAAILLRVHPGKVIDVADSLVSEESVTHIAIINGRFDIFLWVVCRNSREMAFFIRDRIANTPGVLRHETMLLAGMPKQTFTMVSHKGLID